MKQAPKHICQTCGQEQNLTADNELECQKCGYTEPQICDECGDWLSPEEIIYNKGEEDKRCFPCLKGNK